MTLTLGARLGTLATLWFTWIGSGGAALFPDLVRAGGLFADSFIDASMVRLIAVPLFLVCSALLTDHYYGWSRGLLI